MQPLISAMTSLRDMIIAAFKSLTRGRSFIQALLAFWVSPNVLKECHESNDGPCCPRPAQDFLLEVEDLLSQPIESAALLSFSRNLKTQFRQRLWSNRACMLPSYNYQLPNGSEQGRYLAVDVGGSTLRVALVELKGLEDGGYEGCSRIVRIDNFRIDFGVKALVGRAFFDWMAARILETIRSASEGVAGSMEELNGSPQAPIPVGLAWSFPIEQTSLKGGLLQNMGKGFLAADGLLGQDLGEIVKQACSGRGLHVEVSAIINDSSAALLSESYRRSSTRFGLILGTGFNIAAYMPVTTIDRPKFGARPAGWFDKASHVIVNTEMGMFGQGFLPMTRWDEQLKAAHPKPEFQPLEHFVAGLYIGELARLIMVEAIETTGLFGGVVPPSLKGPYTLETETFDDSPNLEKALAAFASRHLSSQKPLVSDILALRSISKLVTRRSAAMVAAALYGLWELKRETENEHLEPQHNAEPARVRFAQETRAELDLGRVVVGFNGSVIEQYPGYRTNCQLYIDALFEISQHRSPYVTDLPHEEQLIELVPAKESSLLGAAVALACLERGKAN
ncbi:hypothetical protein PpBr36_08534 [Pyricularia pennisetigena]|uniref:hypothetical protein n=1 Tax=Pyricularia pennisetigena TaxID=1578925 RepID=UPI00115363C9|nr:hypothetical protein PpBr36_08534 [Pyricularia pennisetigena]TLS24337.1 hypothetical protein PpBr36_08534 [Pyricularia pennisetigena]